MESEWIKVDCWIEIRLSKKDCDSQNLLHTLTTQYTVYVLFHILFMHKCILIRFGFRRKLFNHNFKHSWHRNMIHWMNALRKETLGAHWKYKFPSIIKYTIFSRIEFIIYQRVHDRKFVERSLYESKITSMPTNPMIFQLVLKCVCIGKIDIFFTVLGPCQWFVILMSSFRSNTVRFVVHLLRWEIVADCQSHWRPH